MTNKVVIKTAEDYQKASARHDQKDSYEGVRKRLQENPDMVINTLAEMVIFGAKMDFIKKIIAYGAVEGSPELNVKIDKRQKEVTELLSKPEDFHLELFKDEKFARLYHYYLGLFTESAELLEALVKALKTGKLDLVNLKEEHGDLDWYKSQASTTIGSTLIEEMQLNDNKLAARYDGGYTNDQALKRNLENEREILEGKKK
jgi:hypothetical protein